MVHHFAQTCPRLGPAHLIQHREGGPHGPLPHSVAELGQAKGFAYAKTFNRIVSPR